MEKRLKDYIQYIGHLLEADTSCSGKTQLCKTEIEDIMKDLLIHIRFFSHERFVHLIVTVTFALLTIITFVGFLICKNLGLLVLIALLLLLLIPYIRHYYILENGVQRLYAYYEELKDTMNRMKI